MVVTHTCNRLLDGGKGGEGWEGGGGGERGDGERDERNRWKDRHWIVTSYCVQKQSLNRGEG